MSQEAEMSKELDRMVICVYSEPPYVQRYEEMWLKQEKSEWKNKFKLITDELKQKSGESFETYKMTSCPEEEQHGNSKERGNSKETLSSLRNNRLDSEEKDAFGASVSVVCHAFPQHQQVRLGIVFPSHTSAGSLEYTCQSSPKLYLSGNKVDSENGNEPGVEGVFNTSERFSSDTGNKVRNSVVTFEVKEDQEIDVPSTEGLIQNSTCLGAGQMPQCRDPKSNTDVWLACSSEMRHVTKMERHKIPAVAQWMQDSFQKPCYADDCSASNHKNLELELENMSSSLPRSDRASKAYLNEELQQDIQKFKNEIGMLQLEFLALERAKVQLQKEVEVDVLLLSTALSLSVT